MIRTPMTIEERHEFQHNLITERIVRYQRASTRTRQDIHWREEHYKKAVWTLDGHLRGMHGWKHTVGPPVGLDELKLIHARKHAPEEETDGTSNGD